MSRNRKISDFNLPWISFHPKEVEAQLHAQAATGGTGIPTVAVTAQGVRDKETFMGEGHCLAVYLWDLIPHRLAEKGWVKRGACPCIWPLEFHTVPEMCRSLPTRASSQPHWPLLPTHPPKLHTVLMIVLYKHILIKICPRIFFFLMGSSYNMNTLL